VRSLRTNFAQGVADAIVEARGTNENTYGLLWEYLPKRRSMAPLTQRDCDMIAAKLNHRPRKRFGLRTGGTLCRGDTVAVQR
jgi:IS30 family transposase